MPCTVIRPGDMADNILDRDKHPEWQRRADQDGLRVSHATRSSGPAMPRSAPRACGNEGDGRRRPSSIGSNREAMDAGAVVAWPERYNHDELSAIQHAMNLKLQDEAAFFAEYQNEPLPEEIARRRSADGRPDRRQDQRLQRGEVPVGCNHLTMFIDVQADAAVLRRRRLGGRFHRLRGRLRRLSRPEAGLLHAPRRPTHAGAWTPQAPAWKARSTPGWRR